MVKEKPNSIRIYDKDGFRRRAACICVKSEAETEVSGFVLLIIIFKIVQIYSIINIIPVQHNKNNIWAVIFICS